MIEIDHISKRFGKIQAVDDVSLQARDGRITGLLGPNGAGKSTSLRIIAGVLQPDGGTARVDGMDVAKDPLQARLRMGVLPHAGGLYPRLTGRENIRYFGTLNGLDKTRLDRNMARLIERLEMAEFVDRPAKGYSQGQRLKVALARAMVHEPRNVVLDEPTNGLDVMATRALRELIRQLKAEGHCILFSSHVMQEVAALCDEIVIIAHGRVVASGTPDDIRHATGCEDLEEAFVHAVGEEHREHVA